MLSAYHAFALGAIRSMLESLNLTIKRLSVQSICLFLCHFALHAYMTMSPQRPAVGSACLSVQSAFLSHITLPFGPVSRPFPMSLCLSRLQDHVFSEAYSGQRLPSSPVKLPLPMSLCLSCLQDHVFSEAYSGQRLPFSPVKFLDTWWRSAEGSLAGYQQQDAHEFYLSLLDGLSQPTERSTTPSLSGSLSPAPTSKSATPNVEGAAPYI